MKTKWMRQGWWKWLGAAMFIYVLIGGMITPLHPGITAVSPDNAKPDSNIKLALTGYNTHFKSAPLTQVWLKLDSTHLLKAREVTVISENSLEANVYIPGAFPGTDKQAYLTIITYNTVDGAAIRPSGLYVNDIVRHDEDPNWSTSFDGVLTPPAGIKFPFRSILDETIRNTFFHVALWLAMVLLLIGGLYHAIRYLVSKDMHHDRLSSALNTTAIVYGLLGLATGSIWARYTWGTWWTTDVKLNMAAISMLIYLAYWVLRAANNDFEKRARLSSVYSIFAFAILIPLIFVIPRLTDSLHPGNGGNPALGGEDLDNTLRLFFYPSIISMIILGVWISSLLYRSDVLHHKVLSDNKDANQ